MNFNNLRQRQNLERSITEGAHLRHLFEETRTANANSAPEFVRLQAQEA